MTTTFRDRIHPILMGIEDMLVEKNEAYGDSALNPVRVFSTADPVEQIKVRIDDKISRLARGKAAGEDVRRDLIGYLALLELAENERPPQESMGAAATPSTVDEHPATSKATTNTRILQGIAQPWAPWNVCDVG